jgi:fimbrial chaperone protein
MRSLAVSILGVLAAAGTAAAGTLSVAPIRIELSPGVGTAVLTVHNQEETPVVVQARPSAWSQQAERDELADTHDLLVTPPLFTIPPKGEQILRVALLRQPDAVRELDYRLVLTEVPTAAAAESNGLKVALRITLPVFVAAQKHAAPELSWQHTWLADGRLEIQAHNSGTAHIQILDFAVQSDGQTAPALPSTGARYLLPGTTAHWQLQAQVPPRAPHLLIHGHSDTGDFSVTSDAGAQ